MEVQVCQLHSCCILLNFSSIKFPAFSRQRDALWSEAHHRAWKDILKAVAKGKKKKNLKGESSLSSLSHHRSNDLSLACVPFPIRNTWGTQLREGVARALGPSQPLLFEWSWATNSLSWSHMSSSVKKIHLRCPSSCKILFFSDGLHPQARESRHLMAALGKFNTWAQNTLI